MKKETMNNEKLLKQYMDVCSKLRLKKKNISRYKWKARRIL